MKDNRYQRQIILPEIGASGQAKLSAARVLVIGAGGLGCPVLQNLAGAGVGTIGIVDGDEIELTNLQRQFLFTLHDCGQNKAKVAATAIQKQNTDVKCMVYPCHFTKKNAALIVSDYEIIVDCTDTIETRYLINDVALAKQIPMVYASIHKYQGQLSVLNYKGGPSYRCLFPENGNAMKNINCKEGGVFGVLPNTLGAMQATEVLKIILDIGTVRSGSLLLYDGLNNNAETIDFPRNESQIALGLHNGLAIIKEEITNEAQTINAFSFMEAMEKNTHLIIDIRESYQEPKINHPNVQCVPLAELQDYLKTTDKDKQIILFCQQGNSSLSAANYLIKNGFKNLSHLQSGIDSIERYKY